MSTHREGVFVEGLWVDGTPGEMAEIGLTSAPLQTVAFHLGAFCGAYSDDFMRCKAQNGDPAACALEGRKATRCALDLISRIKATCGPQFTDHYQCLDKNNQIYHKCRPQETKYNDCVFQKLGLAKHVPGGKEGEQIHTKTNPIYK